MNQLKHISVSFLLVFIIQSINAQSTEWFVQGGIGQSRAKFIDSDWEGRTAFHWSYTGGLRYKFNNAISLETGISLTGINSEQNFERLILVEDLSSDLLFTIPGNPYGVIQGIPYERPGGNSSNSNSDEIIIKKDFSRNSRYIGIPISVLIEKNKFGFRSGIKTLFLLDSYEKSNLDPNTSNSTINTSSTIVPSTSFTVSNIKKIDAGILLGLYFNINPNLSLEIDYYHGLIMANEPIDNINRVLIGTPAEGISDNNYKNESLSIGISYSFSAPQ